MDCLELLELISDYLDGVMEEDMLVDLESHIHACRKCQIMVETTRRTISISKNCFYTTSIPKAVHTRLHYTLRMKIKK